MSKIVLSLAKMTREDKIKLVNTVEAKAPGVTGFPTPNPKQVELLAARDLVKVRQITRNTKEAELRSANTDLGAADERFDAALTSHAAQVQEVTNGDESKITLLGYSVAGVPQSIGPMPKPENVSASVGDNDGELDVSFNRIYGARSYELQTSPDPITETSWVHALVTTRSSVTLPGLPRGTVRWVRVRAVGSGSGAGPWSDPACCMVP